MDKRRKEGRNEEGNKKKRKKKEEWKNRRGRKKRNNIHVGPSRMWVPLFGTVSHRTHPKSALFHGICPARFKSSLKLLFSLGPWLGAPLSSYLKCRYINSIDR